MPSDKSISPAFLQNGGECGALLRGMHWSNHPLGAPENWPVMLQTTVSIVLGSRQPMLVCWGPQYHTIYNDGYSALCGNRHPAGQGIPFSEIWFDIWDVVGPMVARVNGGESIYMDQLELLLHRHGYPEKAYFSFSYNPLRNDKNQVTGMFCACEEITEKVVLRRELEHERARLGEVFEQAPSFFAKLHGPDHIFELANPAFLRLIGHREVIGKSVATALPEVQSQGYIEMLDKVLTTGSPIRIDGAKVAVQRAADSPPEDRFIDFVYQPVIDTTGAITGVIAAGVDVTDRTEALSALQNSEQLLRSVLGASSDCIKVLDLDGRLIYISDGGRLIMEMPDDLQIEGCPWPDFWREPGLSEANKALALARTGAASAFQGYANSFADNRRFWDVRVTPMLDAAGRPERILAVSRDITHLKLVEEEREHLMRELSHRLKNAFGMVQSVISQTLRHATSVKAGHVILAGRVRALADAQDILTRSIVGEMQIDEVVEAALLPHRTGEGQFRISGPMATISGRQGLGLSLALHELATNATKYGSLSTSKGGVTINWDVQPMGTFSFTWQESDGPPVTPPVRSGFGSVLIEKIVATYFNGSAALDFRPSGVTFQLSGTIAPPDTAQASDPY